MLSSPTTAKMCQHETDVSHLFSCYSLFGDQAIELLVLEKHPSSQIGNFSRDYKITDHPIYDRWIMMFYRDPHFQLIELN